ncbi:MAG: hypothetical protein BWY84_01216 [Candidatus Aerophobetes bacterium ADurb.Bin490]|nr:MAG: hypothetical protein BWY84_01216 [Candidatus Aerophobetes bacterium ADurb.Bin490]
MLIAISLITVSGPGAKIFGSRYRSNTGGVLSTETTLVFCHRTFPSALMVTRAV